MRILPIGKNACSLRILWVKSSGTCRKETEPCVFRVCGFGHTPFLLGGMKVPDYKELYYKLFAELTDLIEELKELQLRAEERYLTACEEDEKA